MKIIVIIKNLIILISFFNNFDSSAKMAVQTQNNSNIKIGFGNWILQSNGEEQIIKEFIPEDGMVFDVGANVGEWSETVFARHSGCKIFAFEPLPQLQEQLAKRLQSNATKIFPIALSDVKGVFPFTVYPEADALSSLYDRQIISDKKHFLINICTDTVDNVCTENNIDRIDFLKIDTEGNEYKILLGASGMLRSGSIKNIQFEYGGTYLDANTKLKDVYNLLVSYGYKIYRISKNLLIYIDKWDPLLENYDYSNYLACLN